MAKEYINDRKKFEENAKYRKSYFLNLRNWTAQYASWKINEEKIKRIVEMGFQEKQAKVYNKL